MTFELPHSSSIGATITQSPRLYHSCAGDQLGALASLLVKLLTSTVNKVIATAVPIGRATYLSDSGLFRESEGPRLSQMVVFNQSKRCI